MNFSLASAGEIVYTTKTERKSNMAIKKETAGKTAKKETKTDTPDVNVKVLKIDGDIEKMLSDMKANIMMQTVVIGILTGALSDREITEQNRRKGIKLGNAVRCSTQVRYGFKKLELLGALAIIDKEIMPRIHEDVKKELEVERKSKKRSEKKEAK